METRVINEDRDFFAPEGVDIGNDDANRKFVNMYLLAWDNKEAKLHVVSPVAFDRPWIHYYHDGCDYKAHRNDLRIARLNPPTGVMQFADEVLKVSRNGNRQWQYGLNSEGIEIYKEGIESRFLRPVSEKQAKAIFFPQYIASLDIALNRLTEKSLRAAALNRRFWLRRIDGDDEMQVVLYRNHIPMGVFWNGKKASFMLNNPCSTFKPEVDKLIWGQ